MAAASRPIPGGTRTIPLLRPKYGNTALVSEEGGTFPGRKTGKLVDQQWSREGRSMVYVMTRTNLPYQDLTLARWSVNREPNGWLSDRLKRSKFEGPLERV